MTNSPDRLDRGGESVDGPWPRRPDRVGIDQLQGVDDVAPGAFPALRVEPLEPGRRRVGRGRPDRVAVE